MSSANVITGIGLVTPLGVGVRETWQSILLGRHVIDVGRVSVDRVQRVSRVGQLGLIAAREAIAYRDLTDAALIVGTSKGPADEWLRDPTTALGLATLSDELASELQMAGSPRLTLSAACASGLHAVARATMLLDRGEASRVIVVASESSLHPIWHGTFKRLGVLAPPGQPCRPFDEHRHGFVISEAAAAIVIERRVPEISELIIERALIAADATHLTGTDPEAKSLRRLLNGLSEQPAEWRQGTAALQARTEIDFVHAHATGTAVDAIELAAIRGTIGDVATYSHKGSLGHTLGASGLVAIALSTQAHASGTIPPMPTTTTPIDTFTHACGPREIRRSIVLASGFGGALAGVRLATAGEDQRRLA